MANGKATTVVISRLLIFEALPLKVQSVPHANSSPTAKRERKYATKHLY